MSNKQMTLIEAAKARDGKILVIGSRKSFEESFTTEDGKLMFWYDTPDHSSHMIMED